MSMKPHILVVDDEADVREVVQLNLGREGYEVTTAADGQEGLEMLKGAPFDAAVIDVMMPGMDGLTLCREIRQDPNLRQLPILLLTARDTETDQIIGLEVGADDFVSKSASPRLIASRLKNLLRRTRQTGDDAASLKFGRLIIDSSRREVRRDGKPVPLTALEYDLLNLLARNRQRVFTREDLLEAVWDEVVVNDRTVDVHIKNLRQKIRPDGDLIETVRGVGYRVRRTD